MDLDEAESGGFDRVLAPAQTRRRRYDPRGSNEIFGAQPSFAPT